MQFQAYTLQKNSSCTAIHNTTPSSRESPRPDNSMQPCKTSKSQTTHTTKENIVSNSQNGSIYYPNMTVADIIRASR